MPDNRETNEMIERVAKAIYDAHVSRQPRPEDWDRWRELIAGGHQGRHRVEDTRALARAAIEAMREPTEAMKDAGYEHGSRGLVWRAMIDTALGIVR